MDAALSFREMLARVRNGDENAAKELVLRYQPEILRAVKVRLTDPNLRRSLDSADICQSVLGAFFVRVVAGQFDLMEPTQLVKLLARMARNKIIDHANKAANRETRTAESGLLEKAPASAETPSEIVSSTELVTESRRLMSADELALIEMRVAGKTWQEIGDEIGKSADAARRSTKGQSTGYVPNSRSSNRMGTFDKLISQIRSDQRSRWEGGNRVNLESFLSNHPELIVLDDKVLDLIYAEVLLREEFGEAVTVTEYVERFPKYATELTRQFEVHIELRDSSAHSKNFQASLPDSLPSRPEIPGYEIGWEIGRGAWGVVYEARQLSLNGRPVAIKIVRPDRIPEVGRATLRRDAKAAALLSHPNIAQVFDCGEHRGVLYVVLELVEGGTLADRLADGPIAAAEAVRVIEIIARAIHHAHVAGVIHRDLKPANILMTTDGNLKITDFGLAKRMNETSSLAPAGAMVGTWKYMSPEQATGTCPEVGPEADVWAIGVMFHELLTGQPPFNSSDPLELIRQIRSDEPASPPRKVVSRDLDAIRRKCLAKKADDRYGTAKELADDLGRWRRGEPTVAKPMSFARKSRSLFLQAFNRRVRTGILFACLGGLLLLTYQRSRQKLPTENLQSQGDPGILAPNGAALPFRTIYGGEHTKVTSEEDGTLAVHSWGLSLIEFSPGNETEGKTLANEAAGHGDHYLFRAQVRHRGSDVSGRVGMYFAHQTFPGISSEVHLLGTMMYDDIRSVADHVAIAAQPPPLIKAPAQENRPHIEFSVHERRQSGPWFAKVEFAAGAPFKVCGNAADCWRSLEIVVSPDGVSGSFDGRPVGSVKAANIEARLSKRIGGLREKAGNDHLTAVASRYDPSGGLGFVVDRSSVSFRQVEFSRIK